MNRFPKPSKAERRRIVQLRKMRACNDALDIMERVVRNPRAAIRNEKKIVVIENRT